MDLEVPLLRMTMLPSFTGGWQGRFSLLTRQPIRSVLVGEQKVREKEEPAHPAG